MAVQKFLIAPQDKGQEDRFKPWLINERAYQQLQNAYIWRGSLKKRFGANPMNTTVDPEDQQLFTRLRVDIGTTDGAGNLPATLIPGAMSTWATLGKMFSAGSQKYTVWLAGAPALTKTTGAGVGNYNTATGQFTLTGGPALATVYYYPSQPVMHFGTYQIAATNDETLFAFDQQFAYTFSYGSGWQRSIGIAATNNTWTGSNSDFFWTTNYRGPNSYDFYMFVTNNVAADAMRYWTGTSWLPFGAAGVGVDNTSINGTKFVKTCAIIEPFKNRLLLFNVTEDDGAGNLTVYRNRIRFSKQDDPLAADSWRQDIPGKGGFIEAPIKESITSVNFLKDRCIVFFESSTWELVDTGNQITPFVFQRLNTELGVESMNSVIPFDKVLLGFGNVGIHACNGLNVDRVDELIPTTIFQVSNANQGPQRVTGIRDYYNELAYWSFQTISTDTGANQIYPTRVLVYNYIEENWAYNDDSITAFGYYQANQDLTWEATELTWAELDIAWNDPSTSDRFPSVIAGNQQGWTFICNADFNKNSMALQISNVEIADNLVTFTAYNHNLQIGSYVFIQNVVDDDTIGDTVNGRIFQVNDASTVDKFSIVTDDVVTGTYEGGGVVTRVSEIDILTKQYNFFYDSASNMAINKIDFYVDKSADNITIDDVTYKGPGEITVDYYIASAQIPTVGPAIINGSFAGTSILETTPYIRVRAETNQNRFWHTLYPNFFGENIQLHFYWTPEQIMQGDPDDQTTTPYTAFADFQLNAMIFYAEATNRIGG